MAATRTLTWSGLPPSEDPEASAPTISLVPASPPASTPNSPSTSANSPPINTSTLSSSLQTAVPITTFPTFPHFSSLPREIQFIIWDFAITSVGAAEHYEPYQLLIPAWKYFSTHPWHKGLSCCVPKQKVLCAMMGGRNVRRGFGNVTLNSSQAGEGLSTAKVQEGAEEGKRKEREMEEMVKRSAHPHIHAERCGKTIYLSPRWARSGLGGIANSCLTGRWLVLEYMRNGLEGFECGCLEVEKEHVLQVLREVVEEMDGRLRGQWSRRDERAIALKEESSSLA